MRHINEGDLVKLRFTDIQDIRAWVLKTPQGAGDDWEFQETKNSRIFSQNPYDAKFRGCDLIVKKQDLGDES